MRHLVGAALLLMAPGAVALTAGEVIEQAQSRNGFSTWHDRKSLVTLQGFDGEVSRVMREAEVYERTDPRGEHRTLMEYLSPDEFKGTRYLHVSPRRRLAPWTLAARLVYSVRDDPCRYRLLGTRGVLPGEPQPDTLHVPVYRRRNG